MLIIGFGLFSFTVQFVWKKMDLDNAIVQKMPKKYPTDCFQIKGGIRKSQERIRKVRSAVRLSAEGWECSAHNRAQPTEGWRKPAATGAPTARSEAHFHLHDVEAQQR